MLRAALRRAGSYTDAGMIRTALTAAGLDIQDTPSGTRWAPRARPGAATRARADPPR